LEESLVSINNLVNSSEVKESLRNLNATLIDVRQLAQRVEKQVDPIASNANQALQGLQKLAQETDGKLDTLTASVKETATAATSALEQTRKTMASVEDLSASGSPVRYELLKTLRELSDAARSLRVLSDFLEQQPNAVIFGRRDGDR
jgi:paraquat-inducible protein B